MITYEIKQTMPSSNTYTVDVQVLDAVGIEPAIFVFDSEYMGFTGVATVYDMLTWPATRDVALMSYRATGVVRTFTSITDAESFVVITKARILDLENAWSTYTASFVAEEIVEVD